MWVMYMIKYYSIITKQNPVIYIQMDRTEGYGKWNEPDTKRQMSDVLFYIWKLKSFISKQERMVVITRC